MTADTYPETCCPTCGRELSFQAMDFGARLRALRERQGWSQKEAAERLGIPQTTLSTYEKRRGWNDEKFCRKAASLYGVPVTVLLGLDEPASLDREHPQEGGGDA